ncbi:MAG: hypothetical protein II936_01130 [Oscillospiraceae bacterium]|nr:hypothetical protein [Oscillospiraceae bacterium]
MPDAEVKFREVTDKEFRQMMDTEKAAYLLTLPARVPSDSSREKWRKCLEFARMRAHTVSITGFREDKSEKELRELEAAAGRISDTGHSGDGLAEIKKYTRRGCFDAVRFIEDRRRAKALWDGHILSAEDVQAAREMMAQGTPKEDIHDTIKAQQRERLIIRTREQAKRMNATPGKRQQPYCVLCMNRGYNAVVENEIFISLQICDCLKRYEQSMDKMRDEEKAVKLKREDERRTAERAVR